MMNCIGRRENTRRFGGMGKPATTLSRAVKRFVGFEFFFSVLRFIHVLFLISLLKSFLWSRISSCYCHFTFSLTCLCQYCN